jgi:two-component system, NarL family, sensor histidine kinase LiaS
MRPLLASLLCCLLAIGWGTSFAYTTTADSVRIFSTIRQLESRKPSFHRDTQLVHQYRDAAFYFLLQDSRFVEKFAFKALKIAQENKWEKGKLIAYDVLVNYYLIDADYDQVMELATANYVSALHLNERVYKAKAMMYMAHSFLEYQRMDSAAIYYKETLAEFKKVGRDSLIAAGHESLANFYRLKGDFSLALYNYQKAKKLYAQIGSDFGLAYTLRSEGFMLVNRKKYPDAIQNFKKSYELFNKLNVRFGTLSALNDLANVHTYTQEYDKAIAYAKEALAQAEIHHSVRQQNWALMTLHRSYKATGNIPEALAAMERVNYSSRTIQSDRIGHRSTLYQLLFDNQQMDLEIKKKIIEKQEATQRFLLGFSLLILFVMALLWWNNDTLRRKNKEIREALVQGQTLERKRVAAELHDNLGSTISTINWYLYGLDKSTLSGTEHAVYDRVQQMVQKAYEEVRNLSHNLLPKELEKEGLKVAMQKLHRKLNENGRIRFELEIEGFEERLDRKTEFELYSIVLELANNIIRHSAATQAFISLQNFEEQITMQVEDNGKGFGSMIQEGMGLSNVQNRVDSLHGKMRIVDKKELGACIQLQIPRKVNA